MLIKFSFTYDIFNLEQSAPQICSKSTYLNRTELRRASGGIWLERIPRNCDTL